MASFRKKQDGFHMCYVVSHVVDLLQVLYFYSTKSDIHGMIINPSDEWGLLADEILLLAPNSGKKSFRTILGLILKNKMAAASIFSMLLTLKVPIFALLLVLKVWHVKPTCRKSCDANLLMCSDLTLGPSFKVR